MRYLHIGFGANAPTAETLEKLFEPAADWMRYAPSSWVIYTQHDQRWWTTEILKLKPDAHFVIFQIDVASYWGSTNKWIWDWIANNPKRR